MSKATPCPEPLERLDPDPAVAIFALRYPSESEPGRTHDVALTPEGYWSCECHPFCEEDECKHVHHARAFWYARRPCAHPGLTTDLGRWRSCFFCGERYDRAARVLQPLRALCLRRWSLSGIESPWSASERSEDPS